MDPYTHDCFWETKIDNNIVTRTFLNKEGTIFQKTLHNKNSRVMQNWSYFSSKPEQLKSFAYTDNNKPHTTIVFNISKTGQLAKVKILNHNNWQRVIINLNYNTSTAKVIEFKMHHGQRSSGTVNDQLFHQLSTLQFPLSEADFAYLKMLFL